MQLIKHLLETRGHIDRTESQTVPADVVKMLIQGATTFVAKAQNIPDMTAVQDTLRTINRFRPRQSSRINQDWSCCVQRLTGGYRTWCPEGEGDREINASVELRRGRRIGIGFLA